LQAGRRMRPRLDGIDEGLSRGDYALDSHVSRNSLDSANIVIPFLLRYLQPRSVLDLGCKHGEWLVAFKRFGAGRVLGIDLERRRPYVLLAPDEFRVADLSNPLAIDDRFDLAVCIEVAEHLPWKAAEPLVETLTRVAPVVLFSAATPGQGGHGHVNEQPRDYWRRLFSDRGFTSLDCVRPHIWQDPRVASWYRLNMVLFVNDGGLQRWPALREESARPLADDVELVDVDTFRWSRRLKDSMRELPMIARRLIFDLRSRIRPPRSAPDSRFPQRSASGPLPRV
jgi:SAM-dependent methyltransferase